MTNASSHKAEAGFLACIALSLEEFDAPGSGGFLRRRFAQRLKENIPLVAQSQQLTANEQEYVVHLVNELLALIGEKVESDE